MQKMSQIILTIYLYGSLTNNRLSNLNIQQFHKMFSILQKIELSWDTTKILLQQPEINIKVKINVKLKDK